MIILKNGWEIDVDAELVNGHIVADWLVIPENEVLLYTVEGQELAVWTEDKLEVAKEQRWWYAVYSWLHTVTSRLKRKVQ